jgi:hypothetical protein
MCDGDRLNPEPSHHTDPPAPVRLPGIVRGVGIASTATPAQLAALGIYPDGGQAPVPDGKQATGWRREIKDGLSMLVPIDLVDIPEEPSPDISPRQLRLWLISMSVPLKAIDGFIDAIDDPVAMEQARVEWEYALSYKHNHPLVQAIGHAIGFTDEQMDAAFREASLIE